MSGQNKDLVDIFDFFVRNPSYGPVAGKDLAPDLNDDDLSAIFRDNFLWPLHSLRSAKNPGFMSRAFHVACVISGIRPCAQSITHLEKWFGLPPYLFGDQVTPMFIKKVFDVGLGESTWRVRYRNPGPYIGQLSRDLRVATIKAAGATVLKNRSALASIRMKRSPAAPYDYEEYTAYYDSYINGGKD